MAFTFSGIISAVFMVLSFYFTLSFFQYLKAGDERLIGQSKKGAVVCLAISLLIATIFYI